MTAKYRALKKKVGNLIIVSPNMRETNITFLNLKKSR